MTDWNKSWNYKRNYNKPTISHTKSYKGTYKNICYNCLNPCNIDKTQIKYEICKKPICPDIIEIYDEDECIYKPNFKTNKIVNLKDLCKVEEECNESIKPIKCKKKKNIEDYCVKDREMDKLEGFITLLTNKIINV